MKIGLMYGNYKREEYFNKIKGYISIGYNFWEQIICLF